MQYLLPFGFVSDLGEEKPRVHQVWRDSLMTLENIFRVVCLLQGDAKKDTLFCPVTHQQKPLYILGP